MQNNFLHRDMTCLHCDAIVCRAVAPLALVPHHALGVQ